MKAPSAGELIAGSGSHALIVGRRPAYFSGKRILDVGARDDVFTRAAGQARRVFGVDLYYAERGSSLVADAQRGLPFGDRAFDTVVALEILEHTDRPIAALDEILRVADRHCVISLPNMYQFSYRLRVLRGQPISGKYWLTTETAAGRADRHKWFFTPGEALRLVRAEASARGFELEDWCWIAAQSSRWPLRVWYRWAVGAQRTRELCAATIVFYLVRRA
jgi:2-polyprenyl-3-methyl-5-hydroxy-6-metoxy-1,4-benzoquinol methylase